MHAHSLVEAGDPHGRQVVHFLVDVTAHGRDNLSRVLSVVFSAVVPDARPMCATHWRVDDGARLLLFDAAPQPGGATQAMPFPMPLSTLSVRDFVWDWLQAVEYPADEHDGASIQGWQVWNESFGIVDGCWQAFAAVRPMWIYLPK